MANYPNPQLNDPLILLVPGHADGGPSDWMKAWERQRSDCRRLDLGTWDRPHRNTWVNKLNLAIHRAQRPVVLVAHDIACLAVAWWAEYEQPSRGNPVVSAMLVAPPDVDRPGTDPRLARFGACPRKALPFPSFLVASDNDDYCQLRTARMLAQDWGSRFVFAGTVGHINADSGLGDWVFGQELLGRLLRDHRDTQDRLAPPALRDAARQGRLSANL